ncbi:ANTAR domain-containing protein [Streptomyces ferrugineus]|uniref:ANTAR domain-containing protein n=1 Tax=Streptomyces ferrugineus TaxID=1413221 RepID=A0A7M2SCE9_9ACTN|nr:ANTAR domain-containing protein [Streptomyces ferrugineus]QOV33435.1 ANTAR domain-containing protein [Streptomyces ferrugineus]
MPELTSQAQRLTTALHLDGKRVRVEVCGELDLDTGERLRNCLHKALSDSVQGVELDLSGVSFCDCDALDILLSLRQRALKQGKTVVVRISGGAVDRLVTVTDPRAMFADSGADGQDTAARHTQDAEASVERDEDLRTEIAQLRRAMHTRPTIDLARGILMASFGLDSEDAWAVLVAVSQNTNTKLHSLAGSLVAAVKGDPLPEGVREQLSAAVAKVDSTAGTPQLR